MIGAKLGILFYCIHETFHFGGSEACLANLKIFRGDWYSPNGGVSRRLGLTLHPHWIRSIAHQPIEEFAKEGRRRHSRQCFVYADAIWRKEPVTAGGGYLEPLLDSYEENNLKPIRFNWSRLLILGRVQQVAMQLRSLSKRRHHEDRGQTLWAILLRFSHHHRSTQKGRKKGEVEQILAPVFHLHKVSPC